MRKLSYAAQKVILLLEAGVCLGLSRNPRQYFRVLKWAHKEWKDINRRAVHKAIRDLYKSKMLSLREFSDETVELILTNEGREQALCYKLDEIGIPRMSKWDKKWRVVLFDIPEKNRKARDAFRFHLKKLNFFEYQKSVFVHPYDCLNEINFLIEFHNVRPDTRFIIADSLDNEFHLKQHFKL